MAVQPFLQERYAGSGCMGQSWSGFDISKALGAEAALQIRWNEEDHLSNHTNKLGVLNQGLLAETLRSVGTILSLSL